MTEKQRVIYNIIKDFIKENGYSPTIREIGKIANLSSSSTTHSHIVNLKRLGYITMVEGKVRTIKVVK